VSLRVGSLVFDTSQGLGVLGKAFFDHGVLSDVLVVEHGRRESNRDWYPGAPRLASLRNPVAAYEFARDLDVMLFLETAFVWPLIPFCREHGVKTVLLVNHECMPRQLPYQPDFFLCPSPLDQRYFPERSVYLPVPVEVPWKLRTRAEVFVHNAGHGGLRGRNGTAELLAALPHVKSPARFVVRSQDRRWAASDPRLEVRFGTAPYESLWEEGDCLVWPHKFDGLSLPLNEARAAGMLVMSTDRFPDNEWLPREPLIPVAGYARACVSPRCLEFDEARIDPRAIAAKIDDFYGRDITEYSLAGRRWAEENSWGVLGPKYRATLEGLS
jgi:hypothetical protein